MTLRPVLVDIRPGWLAPPRSLLTLPVGRASLLHELTGRLRARAGEEPVVLPTFPPDRGWRELLDETAAGPLHVVGGLDELFDRCEPADWLLVVDVARWPLADWPEGELRLAACDPRRVTHVLAMPVQAAAAEERVCLDNHGRVRRIERYYAGVTSGRARATCATLLSGSAARSLPSGSGPVLPARLRALCASRHLPARDLVLEGDVLDLALPPDLLELSERCVRAATDLQVAAHPGARGPVIVQPGARIDPGAAIIGPALIGRGAQLEPGALVVQSLVADGVRVPAGTSVRHRVWLGPDDAAQDPDYAAGRKHLDGCAPPPRSAYACGKRIVDAVIAGLGILVLAPLLAVVALAIKLTSRGPVLYGDFREGRGGRVFRCWKFRTMVPGADSLQRRMYDRNLVDGPQFKLKHDTRVTAVGRWLRATNIDELPQLFNVVRGEMSLIGPRPSPFRENQICVGWRRARLSVRPGITGLWQVCRDERSAGDFHQWIHYDTLYVRHQSALLDLKILLATLLTMGGQWPVPLHWMLPRGRGRNADEFVLPLRAPILELHAPAPSPGALPAC